jgi:hypothetical protein
MRHDLRAGWKFCSLDIHACFGRVTVQHRVLRARADRCLELNVIGKFEDGLDVLRKSSRRNRVYDDPDGDSGNDSENEEKEETPLSASTWVLMAADQSWMTAPGLLDRAEAIEPHQPGPAWTDDFNNILSAIRLGELPK